MGCVFRLCAQRGVMNEQLLQNPEDFNHIVVYGTNAEVIPQINLDKLIAMNKMWSKFKVTCANEREDAHHPTQCSLQISKVTLLETEQTATCDLIVECDNDENSKEVT